MPRCLATTKRILILGLIGERSHLEKDQIQIEMASGNKRKLEKNMLSPYKS